MKRRRRVPFLLFVVCLVAAMPFAWGQVGLEDATLEPSTSLEAVKIDVLKVGVTLCHIPPGDPANAQTIVVGQSAVAAHLAHGDSLGECYSACDGVPAAVPKTGQTGCWDVDGYTINCAGTGQDGEYQKGVSVDPRFTENADGTVKDNQTGLIWLKNASCFGWQNWTSALSSANTLASGACGLSDGSVAGDWRLPNRKEWESLLDLGRRYPALPAGHPFSGVQSFSHWSSTTYKDYPYLAWVVDLYDGSFFYEYKLNSGYVWPVRGGQ